MYALFSSNRYESLDLPMSITATQTDVLLAWAIAFMHGLFGSNIYSGLDHFDHENVVGLIDWNSVPHGQ